MRSSAFAKVLVGACGLALSAGAAAEPAGVLRKFVGYTILDVKTIEGWKDHDKPPKEGDFEGCESGRVIFFSDGKALTCAGYGYHYAYRPDAVILAKSITYGGNTMYDIKMVVDDEVYDMRK